MPWLWYIFQYTNTMKELFKDIPWYKWIFQVSNLWTIKRLSVPKKNHSKINIIPERISKWFISGNWYVYISLRDKRYLLSRIVASSFLWLDLSNKKIYVCHKDDNPLNNNVDNLFLWTCKENHTDMMVKWRMAVNEMLPHTRLNSDMVNFIRDSKWKMKQNKLAKMFNVNPCHISRIQNNLRRNYA